MAQPPAAISRQASLKPNFAPAAVPRNRDDQVIRGTLAQCRRERSREGLAHCIASRDPLVGALAAPVSSAASLFAAET